MLVENIRPSTIIGIKRLASRIKKSEGVTHKQALSLAARAASFENFEHARKVLENGSARSQAGHQLFLTAYWTDRDTYEIGRETFEARLSVPLLDLCTKSEMRLIRGLCGLRLAAADHLVKDTMCQSQDFARDQLCQALRALRFMEATRLRPCTDAQERKAKAGLDDDLPGTDHSSGWYDPSTSQFVLLDEPYTGPRVTPERADWATRNGWHFLAAKWPGIYFPYRCSLFVGSAASSSFDFGALMKNIDALPAPVTAEKWSGSSVDDHTLFLTPAAKSAQDRHRAKAKGTIVRRPSKKTVPYLRSFIGTSRKPNGRMSLEGHEYAGRMIGAVLQSRFKPWAINEQLQRLRSTLVDWLYEDVSHRELARLDDPVEIYYGHDLPDADVARAGSGCGVQDVLADLKRHLRRAYPDCAPLRRALRRLERSMQMTQAFLDKMEKPAAAARR